MKAPSGESISLVGLREININSRTQEFIDAV